MLCRALWTKASAGCEATYDGSGISTCVTRMRITRRRLIVGIGVALATAVGAMSIPPVRRLFHPVVLSLRGKRTVDDRVREFSAARARVQAVCGEKGVQFPPQRVVLLGLKQEQRLDVYAGAAAGSLHLLQSYPIRAASGVLGPKLREGDLQVPEGVYAVESLNPNSRFHVALRVAYPNDVDVAIARREGRTDLGSDIMIHGGAASIGCLAMGDAAIEELFVLAADVGIENVTIVLSPVDLRVTSLPAELQSLDDERYSAIRAAFDALER